MSTVTMECNVTEYAIIPPIEYEKVAFCLNEKCIVISFMNDIDEVITQSEIEKEDAVNLAKLILLQYETNT